MISPTQVREVYAAGGLELSERQVRRMVRLELFGKPIDVGVGDVARWRVPEIRVREVLEKTLAGNGPRRS